MKKNMMLVVCLCAAMRFSYGQNSRIWASYYGGNDLDVAYNITTDLNGNVYVCGESSSANAIASAGAYQSTNGGGTDAFLVKFNQAGVRQWATYFGGAGSDYGYGVKTDGSGNVYLTGYTSSSGGIATPGAAQSALNGMVDAYLAKFTPSGNLLWCTYFGGSDYDQAQNVAIDPLGNAYITGFTASATNIASPGSHQSSFNGQTDAFLAKYDVNGNAMWSTYYGGSDFDYGMDVASDALGNVVINGTTSSSSGIASGGFQNSLSGLQDAFVVKFNAAGVRQWATYYGGSVGEEGTGIACGAGGSVFLTGRTTSPGGIASGGFQNTSGGSDDAFLVKFNSAGSRVWATYYGGAATEEGYDVVVDGFDNVFIGGDTYSPNVSNCIATQYGFQTSLGGSENHFIAAFTTNGIRLSATYYGTVHEEECHIAVTTMGGVYASGFTNATTGIASGGFQNSYGGNPYDAFLVKFSPSVPDTGVIVNGPIFLPTVTSTPVVITGVSIFNGGGISISSCSLRNFPPGTPLPTSGSVFQTIACDFTGMYSNGGPATLVTCPATLTVKITYAGTHGSTNVYDAELMQLDLAGGVLPSGIILRESPTRVSSGKILSTSLGSGAYKMACYFEANMELSTNSGASWIEGESPSYLRLSTTTSAGIPTLSTWGLIALSVLLMGLGVGMLKNS